MKQRPTTFGALMRRLTPELPTGTYRCPPIVASAVEIDEPPDMQREPFWVVIHSLTDRDVRLLHAAPVRAKYLSVTIEADRGEVVQAIVTAIGSGPKGDLYETTAEFQRPGPQIGSCCLSAQDALEKQPLRY